MLHSIGQDTFSLAVIPALVVGPLQVLLAILPGILVASAGVIVSLFKPRTMLALLKLLWRLKIQVAVAVACVVGIVYGARALRTGSGARGGGGAVIAGADWAMFRGGPDRSGMAAERDAETPAPNDGGIVWEWRKEGMTLYASPAVVGNRVYISSVEGLGVFDREGEGSIYCLDADTGEMVWTFTPTFETGSKRYRGTFSSPVVKGKYLVCGEGLHETKECRVICLDIGDERNVGMIWSYKTDNHVECTPVIGQVRIEDGEAGRKEPRVEDRVFVGNGDTGGYLCFRLETGELLWHLKGDNYLDAETALVYHDNRLYAGLGNDGKAVCVIDAANGKEIARVSTPYPVFSPPAVHGGKLYVGMGNGDYIKTAKDLGLPQIGEVWCLDLKKLESAVDGKCAPDWKMGASDTILGAVAVRSNSVYCASADGWVYRADCRTGAVSAKWNAHDPIRSSPAVCGEYVYVVTVSGMLYCLDSRSFSAVWEFKVAGGQNNFSSPAVARGHVYVGTEARGLVCAGRPSQAMSRVWPGRLAGPEKGGNYYGSPAPELGQFVWNYPDTLDGTPASTVLAAPVAVMGDSVFVAIAGRHQKGGEPGLVCLPLRSDSESPKKPTWRLTVAAGVWLSPALVGERVFYVEGKTGDEDRHLCCVAAVGGAPVWRQPVARDASGAFVAMEDGVLVQDAVARLTCYSLDGTKRWTAPVDGAIAHSPSVKDSLVILATVSPARLMALDRSTGTVLLRADLPKAASTPLLPDKTVVYFGSENGLEARSVLDGSTVKSWRMEGGAVTSDFAADAVRFVYVNAAGELVVLSRKTGSLLAEPVPGALAASSPMLCADRALFFDGKKRIMMADLGAAGGDAGGAEGEQRGRKLNVTVWLEDTSAMGGGPSTPMVMGGSSLYVGWTGWGLLRLGASK